VGIYAALGAGILWGTMYIPYRKAYLTGMNPMSFITFFTVGELATMSLLAVGYRGRAPLWHELVGARAVLFWLMLGGFVWVLGDLFQQYATKYVGISRGIPLSNTNQLWGLLWGVLVFHELRGGSHTVYAQVAGGSLLMALGAVAIALSSATAREHSSWQDAADRERQRYNVDTEYVRAGMEGRAHGSAASGRTVLDWLIILGTTSLFAMLAVMARLPHVDVSFGWAVALTVAMLALLATCGIALWRTTRFR
jgi:drug/metabolite transporter (DMT)-like permease